MVGIFLGSFDPPHIGHLSIVSAALDTVQKVIVVPALSNPWKKNQTPWEIRYRLCEEAFSAYRGKVEISSAEPTIVTDPELQKKFYSEDDLETDRRKTVPSYVLLRYLRDKYGEDSFLVTTVETFQEIKGWNHGIDVLKENKILLIQQEKNETLLASPWANVLSVFPSLDHIKISSTQIRERIKDGRIVHEYLPRKTEELINELNLYKEICQS